MSEFIEISNEEGVTTLRFDRPEKKNAITADMYQDMADAIDTANADADVRCILFLGHSGAFTAGNDIADFARIAMSGGERSSMAVFEFLERIIMAKKPMVAGVDGLAIGVGTTMLMHCDHVIASHIASFRTPFVDLGLIPEAGSSLFAPRLMGHHRAFWLLAMGEKFSPEQAREAGLVSQIVASDDLETQAVKTARSIAAKPPQAMEISRKLIRGDRSDILARMREEAELFGKRLLSEEAKQAFMAFMNR
ncbi:MAG: crotonase/enoyl-CoA hydratase family protein [Hyphomicrobiales bacterium]|nr:crotonase/enoyl-CoA hydratase family protein [Hyphomicrobiales bacterium]